MASDPVSRRALGAALTPLIPVPFVDGPVRRRLLARALRDTAEKAGRALDDATINTLVEDRSSILRGLGKKVLRWPLRRVLGQVSGVLLAKEGADHGAELALRCEMLKIALSRGLLPGRAAEVRDWMDEALGSRGHSPLGRGVMRQGGQEPPPLDERGALADGLRWVLENGDGAAVLARFSDLAEGGQVGR